MIEISSSSIISIANDSKLLNLLRKFHKTMENAPMNGVRVFGEMVESVKNSENIQLAEDCAEFLAEYIKKSGVWKQRAIGECLQKLRLPARFLVLKHFTDFLVPGLSIDYIMSEHGFQWFPVKNDMFRKSKMPSPAFVCGANPFGKLGVGDGFPMISTLTPLDFEFNEAFHGQNHTIFWRRFTGEVWASGKSENFLKEEDNEQRTESYSTPIKLDYINLSDKVEKRDKGMIRELETLQKEYPNIRVTEHYTFFENFTPDRSFFIGNPVEKENWRATNTLDIWEQGANWMVFSRKKELYKCEKISLKLEIGDEKVQVDCERGNWKCEELDAKGAIINYFCGKRVPKMTNLTICEDGSVWYRDKETLYKGSLDLSFSPSGLQLVASLQELPYHFRIGGFSVSPNGSSFLVYANRKRNHLEELHPRHQMDYSIFTRLTFDPWFTYFGDMRGTLSKLDSTREWLKGKYATCFNEYGFIHDELETLTAVSHLYELIKIPPNQSLPDMMNALIGWENDKLAQLLIVQYYQEQIMQTEDLRIRVPAGANLLERVIAKATETYEHMLTVIRAGLEAIQKLQLPDDHEGIWTYVKYVEFVGYYRNRSLGSKGRFETKNHMTTYFQTRDLERIVERRRQERGGCLADDDGMMSELVKVQAIGNRSDKSKMDNFYIYPCIQHVFRCFIEAMDPDLLAHIDENNFLDLNLVCHNDADNTRFVRYIRELTGCEHPRDFDQYRNRISLEHLLLAFPDTVAIHTADASLKVPRLIFRIFSSRQLRDDSDLVTILIPHISGKLFKLAIEALLDMRELLTITAWEKFQIYQLYCHLLFMEAAADVIKLITVSGNEEDIEVLRDIFHSHPLEISQCVAKYRPEILALWKNFPVPTPQLKNLEKITDLILSKRYTDTGAVKPLIMNTEAMFGVKMGEKWLYEYFTSGRANQEMDVERKFQEYIKEDDDVRDFSTA